MTFTFLSRVTFSIFPSGDPSLLLLFLESGPPEIAPADVCRCLSWLLCIRDVEFKCTRHSIQDKFFDGWTVVFGFNVDAFMGLLLH